MGFFKRLKIAVFPSGAWSFLNSRHFFIFLGEQDVVKRAD